MKNRRILCMTALMLAMLLAMGGCKQAEAKETSTQPVEQVEETEETTEEPTIGESTEEELKAEAEAKAKAEAEAEAKAKAEAEAAAKAEAEKKAAEEAAKAEAEKKAAEELKAKEAAEAAAKAEAEKKAAEEAAAKAEAERKAAEEAAKKEQETQQSKPDSSQSQASTPESKPAESKPDTNTSSSSGGYTLNEYGNPSRDIVGKGLVDYINPSDPAITRMIGPTGYHGSTPIPNPLAEIDPISPFIGMKNPPADWPKPDASKEGGGFGEYKWDPETGCWRYYNGKASNYYLSLYGVKTVRCSEKKKMFPAEYSGFSANNRGVY